MQEPVALEIESTRMNPDVDPQLHAWGWEVPIDLFLAATVAGILMLHGMVVLRREEDHYPKLASYAHLVAMPLLGIALLLLMLDLEYKLHAYRFYTTFQPTSPMSWGSWIYLGTCLVGGVFLLHSMAYLPTLRRLRLGRWGLWSRLRQLPGRWVRRLCWAEILLGSSLAIYTGVLLATSVARPLWNSTLLAPLFLSNGVAAAAALFLLLPGGGERRRLSRIALIAAVVQLVVLTLWLLQLNHGGASSADAFALLATGPYAASFWVFAVGLGMLLPTLLLVQGARGRWPLHAVTPALLLIGGLALRFVLVQAGQDTGFGS